jgi:hypothetical protein
MHGTGCTKETNSFVWGRWSNAVRTSVGVERPQKVIYVRQNKAEEVDSSQAVAAIVARMDDPSGE